MQKSGRHSQISDWYVRLSFWEIIDVFLLENYTQKERIYFMGPIIDSLALYNQFSW